MSLNIWGMPEFLGGKLNAPRMKAIAKEISKGNYDLYLLQELWKEEDHKIIATSIPRTYSITGFKQLSSSGCILCLLGKLLCSL